MAGNRAKPEVGEIAGPGAARRDRFGRPVLSDLCLCEAQMRAAAAVFHGLSLPAQDRRPLADRTEGIRHRSARLAPASAAPNEKAAAVSRSGFLHLRRA